MQYLIIPRPQQKNDILDVLRVVGVVSYEDKYRIALQFKDNVSLKKLTRKYPELRELISKKI